MEPEIFDYFPDRPFVDWALDVFPALLEHDVPFYGHEIDDYWNDIGNMREFRQGNFDALTGAVRLDFDPSRLNPRARGDRGSAGLRRRGLRHRPRGAADGPARAGRPVHRRRGRGDPGQRAVARHEVAPHGS